MSWLDNLTCLAGQFVTGWLAGQLLSGHRGDSQLTANAMPFVGIRRMAFDFDAFWNFAEPVASLLVGNTATKVDDHLFAAVRAAKDEGWFRSLTASVHHSLATGEEMVVSSDGDAGRAALAAGVDLGQVLALVTLLIDLWRRFKGQ